MDAAISYKRFSTRKQARGDTERRQADLAEDYCRRHDLQLLDTYLDAGLSGFTGANLGDNGALRALLQAARNGKFPTNTRLIVESLDRLSRQEITTAVRLFLDILDTGLVIVTLIDGEQVFTKQRVDSDLTALIIAVVYLSRANNEAKARRERALHAQQTARRRAREQNVPITAECPAWLTLKGKGKARRFVIDRERAQVIEQIFKMSASGMGQYQIVAYLNSHDVPTFSGKPKWRPGMIGHLLSSPAVIGVFHPCLSVVENGKRRRVSDPEGPIPSYFPAVISAELYEKGRRATEGRLRRGNGRRVPAYTNLVPRIGRCAVCGATLHHFQTVGGWAYLRCANARHRECSNRFGFPYRGLEIVLLALDDLTALVERLCERVCMGRRGPSEIEPLGDDGWRDRFRAARSDARSSDADQRAVGRVSLIAELRRLLEGVVLHPNLTMTVHLRPDPSGCRAAWLIGKDGLRGIQVKAPAGRTGFIDQSVLRSLVAEERDLRDSGPLVNGQSSLESVLERTRIIDLPHGDWQALAPYAQSALCM